MEAPPTLCHPDKSVAEWKDPRSTHPLADPDWKRHPLLCHPDRSVPGFPATLHRTRPRMRLSVRERRMKCTNATKLHRKSGGGEWRDLLFVPSPDGAAVHRSDWLAGLAGKCFLEFGEIAHPSVGAELFR